MSNFRAKRRGSLTIEGVVVPFEKGMNVTALAEQIPADITRGLLSDHIWEDVTVEIKEAQKQMELQLSKVEKAKKAKAKK